MARIAQHGLVQHDSYWDIPIAGLRVIQLRLDNSFGLEFGESSNDFSLRINVDFLLSDTKGEVKLAPERLQECCRALSLFNATVVSAKAFKSGRIEIQFTDGMTCSVNPHSDLEAWEISGRNGLQIISLPGGELGIWEQRSTEAPRAN